MKLGLQAGGKEATKYHKLKEDDTRKRDAYMLKIVHEKTNDTRRVIYMF